MARWVWQTLTDWRFYVGWLVGTMLLGVGARSGAPVLLVMLLAFVAVVVWYVVVPGGSIRDGNR